MGNASNNPKHANRPSPVVGGDGDHTPYSQALASFATHAAAVAAARAILDATDPQAALQQDLRVLVPAWQNQRKGLLSGVFERLWAPKSKDEAQKLLGTASRKGDVKGMQRAVAAGANVRAAVYDWLDGSMDDGSSLATCTAAYLAAANNHGGGLRFLVGACEVDPNAVGDTMRPPRTPLYKACFEGHTDAATVLLALGADPTVAAKDGWTPCMAAAVMNKVPCLRALAAGGPGGALGTAVNAVNKDGRTALDLAVLANAAKAAVCLLELGGQRAAALPARRPSTQQPRDQATRYGSRDDRWVP